MEQLISSGAVPPGLLGLEGLGYVLYVLRVLKLLPSCFD